MKIQNQLCKVLCGIVTLLLISGNAIIKTDAGLKIDLIESERVMISDVKLSQIDSVLKLQGKVRGKSIGRNVRIPGHIDISVVNQEGKTITTNSVLIVKMYTAASHRRNVNSRYANFRYVLAKNPPVGSTIRIQHHNASMQTTH